jgi:hypothetical protein
MESEDPTIAVAAIKVVLSKVMPDLKHEEKSGKVEVEVSGLSADARRVAIRTLEALAARETGSPPATH